jgi:hypothetical protein
VLEPLIVDGNTDGPWLAGRTRACFEGGESVVWWRVRRRGNKSAHEAAALLEDYLGGRTHFPGHPEILWSWRTSEETPLVGAMLLPNTTKEDAAIAEELSQRVPLPVETVDLGD